ncbi:hypothetical protein M422DRAFT_152399 [Sphaerobolus stellatus SS14]|nr:hypothetical protein M422DRAFT_152399 [Sphaerobolus stellatus SS14]
MRLRPWSPCIWSARLHRQYSKAASPPPKPSRRPDKVNFNPSPFDEDSNDYSKFKRVTAKDLALSAKYPTQVTMLVRDFIQDSLYNPHYGYFSKQAVIFSAKEPIDFPKLRNSGELDNKIFEMYGNYKSEAQGPGRQVWHTPTELFKPWYGQSIAQCILSEYMLKSYPYDDLVIYEIGAGNGTLANDILEYIRNEYPPEVYERVRYNIIEISPQLAKIQRKRLASHPGVQIFNKSVFDWDKRDNSSCFLIALEVVDNFAHDEIRYSMSTREPYQGMVAIDQWGDFTQYYERVNDPLISRFLSLRAEVGHESPALPFASPTLRWLRSAVPFSPNLSKPEYIPTRLLELLSVLRNQFPRHRLLLSDFSSLPDTIPGYNAPVVQTRIGENMIPVKTFLVKQGYFDIFFPTQFKLLRNLYEHIMSSPFIEPIWGARASPLLTSSSRVDLGANFFSSGNRRPLGDTVTTTSGIPIGGRRSNVFTHREFMETYATLSGTKLRNGENPLLDYYQNVKFLF